MRDGRGGPSTVDPGLGETRAYPRPRIAISEAEALAGRPARWRVADHTPWRGGFRMTLTPEAGSAVTVDYWVADGLELPVARGEDILIAIPLEGEGLVIRSLDASLRALVSIDGVYADLVGFTLEPSLDASHLMYTEASESAEDCGTPRQVLAHHEAALRDRDTLDFLAPGESRRLSLVETETLPRIANEGALPEAQTDFELVLLDASVPWRNRPQPSDECPPRHHTSWVLLRAR